MIVATVAPHVVNRRHEYGADRVADPFVPVASLAEPVEVVDAATPCPRLDVLFRSVHVTSVAVGDVTAPSRVGLISRDRYLAVGAGTLGYGRALISRRTVGEIVDWDPMSVDRRTPLVDVVRAAMARPAHRRFEDIVVHGSVWEIVTVPTIVRALADAVVRQVDARGSGLPRSS